MNSEIYSRKRNNVDCSGLKSIEVIYTVLTSFFLLLIVGQGL